MSSRRSRADAAPFKDISLGPKGRFPKKRTPDGARFPAFRRLIK